MGVSVKHYVMVGTNIGYKNDDDLHEQLEPYMEDGKELFCLFDGMNGNYIVLGEVISVGDEYDGLNYKEILPQDIEVKASRVRNNLKKLLNIESNPKLIIVSHWY